MEKNYSKANKVRFYLKNKKNGWGSIVAIFNFGYKEDGKYRFYQVSTGEEVPIKSWDSKTQRTIKASVPDWDGINRRLNQVEIDIVNKFDEMGKENLEITPETLKNYKHQENHKKKVNNITLIGFAVNYKETCGKNYKTKRHYGTTINILKAFSGSKRTKLYFNDIDMAFYNSFVTYLEGKNLRINTIGGHIKNLKVFLRQSYSQKIHQNTIYSHKDFKVLQEEVDSIYLTKEELLKIFNLDLSENKTLEQTRDGFILGAFTGLRFSDIKNLKPENIGTDGIIKTTTIKTKKQVCIPIGNITKSILTKYYPLLPKIFSNQKFNDYLKIIAKKAGLTDEVTITHSNGGFHTPYKYPKFQLVSTHTARRSFATNMMLDGVNVPQIMLVTGHSTEESFFKYIKIRPNRNAEMLKQTAYFNFETVTNPKREE
jgi:site-specific recombinase XerD